MFSAYIIDQAEDSCGKRGSVRAEQICYQIQCVHELSKYGRVITIFSKEIVTERWKHKINIHWILQ